MSLQQSKGYTQSSLQNLDSPSMSSQGRPLLDSLQQSNKTSEKDGLIQRADDYNVACTKRRLTQEQYVKRKQLPSHIYGASVVAPQMSPLLPQVVRRSNYLTVIKNASLATLGSKQTQQPPQTRHGSTTPQSPAPTPPRWHSQSCMLFRALRDHPDHAMPRTDLINTALELDQKISAERNYPSAFRGKTPKNSASALLTNNNGRHFQSFRPSGSRSMHFRLTFEPADFIKAAEAYTKWMHTLTTHDWPLCFGKATTTVQPQQISSDKPLATNEFDEFIAYRRKERLLMQLLNNNNNNNDKENHPPPLVCDEGICESIQWPILGTLDPEPTLPTSLQDLVYCKYDLDEKIPTSIHAKCRIPVNTPLGFYFGTPTTEDEFDLAKQDQTLSNKYCIMYNRTVLDATDDQGNLFLDPTAPHYCPYHFLRQAPSPPLANVLLLKGKIYNQVICWSKRQIQPDEELMVWLECEKR